MNATVLAFHFVLVSLSSLHGLLAPVILAVPLFVYLFVSKLYY